MGKCFIDSKVLYKYQVIWQLHGINNSDAQYLGLLLLQKKIDWGEAMVWEVWDAINSIFRCLFFLDTPENYIHRIITLPSLKCKFQSDHTYKNNDWMWTKWQIISKTILPPTGTFSAALPFTFYHTKTWKTFTDLVLALCKTRAKNILYIIHSLFNPMG